MTRLILLDRDGVINREVLDGDSYRAPKNLVEVDFLPGARAAAAELCRRHEVLIWTSQRATARSEGLRQATLINDTILAQFSHEVPPELRPRSILCAHEGERLYCCKPSASIVAHCLQLLAPRSVEEPVFIIGDGDRDMESASLCGAYGILVLSDEHRAWREEHQPEYLAAALQYATCVVPDLVSALDVVESPDTYRMPLVSEVPDA